MTEFNFEKIGLQNDQRLAGAIDINRPAFLGNEKGGISSVEALLLAIIGVAGAVMVMNYLVPDQSPIDTAIKVAGEANNDIKLYAESGRQFLDLLQSLK